jgi:hypothetical protein
MLFVSQWSTSTCALVARDLPSLELRRGKPADYRPQTVDGLSIRVPSSVYDPIKSG